MESYLLFTLFYFIFSVCFVFPRAEFVSVGLTIESLFSFWLENEADDFIRHHMKRTVATLMTHSLIPLGYVLGIKYIQPEILVFEGNVLWWLFLIGATTLPLLAAFEVLDWIRDRWRHHPIILQLRKFAASNTSISQIIIDIDSEYKRVDKIIIKCNAVTRVVATDNWIIKISPYKLNIVHQSDTTLEVSSSDTHNFVPGRPGGGQFLVIDVKSSRPNVESFQIRINSADFDDLQDKMMRPIKVLENVIVHKTLADRFLDAFKQQVLQNPTLEAPADLDVCIGCMQTIPNVKLLTCCGDTTSLSPCTMCYCKPLWCLDCMGKWFASRQDPERPETWLSSKCSCPMCRSRFCILDVCLLVPATNGTSNS